MLQIVVSVLLMPFALYVFYLAYCTLRVARDNGKLAATPLVVRSVAWLILAIGYVLDVLFNVTFGSVMFWEWPHFRRLLFTARCNSHLEASGRRGEIARWVCFGWLNPFEAGHCR
jgi:hypothetical protein